MCDFMEQGCCNLNLAIVGKLINKDEEVIGPGISTYTYIIYQK